VIRLVREQSQNHQLQIVGTQLASGPKAVPTKPAAPDDAAEQSTETMPAGVSPPAVAVISAEIAIHL